MTNGSSSGAGSRRAARLLCFAAVIVLVAACSSRGDKADRAENPFKPGSGAPGSARPPQSERELRLEADQAYRHANESLAVGDYETAITRYTLLIAKYPFSDYATQAELEKIYAQYRSLKADDAAIAADRFLREHPRHPNADYVQYVKGLTDYYRDDSLLDLLPIDGTKRDAVNARRSFDDFALLLQKFPDSRYAGDARKRMLYLRNRISAHELSVVKFYVKRGAWVAASKRAENIIAEYPGAPATADALLILQQCYGKLGQTPQAEDARLLLASNAASIKAANAAPPKAAQRSVVATVAPGEAGAPSATPVAAPPPKGFFGRVGGYLDLLNKTYTVDGEKTGATAPAAVSRPPDSSAPASLTTGPYSGPDSSFTLPHPVRDDDAKAVTPPAAAAAASSAPVATVPAATATPDAPKEKAGLFDFLNKSYTIGGPSKKKTAPVAPTPTALPDAAPAAVSTPSPVVAPAAIAAPEAPKKKAGFFDFLNKTYTIGAPSTKAASEPVSPPGVTSGTAPPGGGTGSSTGIRVYLDYDDDAKKKAEAEAAAKAATPTEAPAPAEPAK